MSVHSTIQRIIAFIVTLPVAVMTTSMTVYAAETNSASGVITDIIKLLGPAVSGMGALVAVVGGVQLGASFSSENPDGKVRGMQTLIGGIILSGISTIVAGVNLSSVTNVTAATLDSLKGVAGSYLQIVGSLVSIVGGIQLASSFTSDNPDGKVRGMQTLVSGSAVAIVASAVKTIDVAINWTMPKPTSMIFADPHVYDLISSVLR